MTKEKMEEFLLKPSYNYLDIMQLEGCKSHVTARKVFCKCIERGGAIKNKPSHVTAKSYWQVCGTTLDEQIRLLRLMKGENDG